MEHHHYLYTRLCLLVTKEQYTILDIEFEKP